MTVLDLVLRRLEKSLGQSHSLVGHLEQEIDERKRGEAVAGAFSPEQVAKMTDPALRRQAQITNRQIQSGQVMINVMQNLESSSTAMATGFTKLAGKPLQTLTACIEGLSMEISKTTDREKAFLSGDVFNVFSSGGK